LTNVSQGDSANYDVVVTNTAGSVTSSLATLTVTMMPAKAKPVIVNGFIIGAILLDGGCGYSNPPTIVFSGQGGSGATAYAQISNGTVTNIVVPDAGSGYPTDTLLLIGPPIYPSLRMTWSPTNIPPATATPIITNGFVVGANLTSGGRGYAVAPTVSFSDVSGHGAAAYAEISNGSVTNIVITSAGSGYSSSTVINISAPPRPIILYATDLMAGQFYQLQVAYDLNSWTNYGPAFAATNSTWAPTNYWNVPITNRMFFRLEMFR
jgi:hypothetical protein